MRGAVVAVLVHALLLALALGWVRSAATTPPGTVAPGFLDEAMRGGGGGGGRSTPVYIGKTSAPADRTPVPPKAVVPPPMVPPPTVPPPKTLPDEAPAPAPAPAAEPTPAAAGGTGTGTGTGAGAGTGPGSGTGTGGGTGAGTGTGTGDGSAPISSPVWRAGALPFDAPPKELRGRKVSVTFWVRADGRVERIAVDPELPGGDYAVRFDETMRGFRFLPARTAAGVAVPATTTLTFVLPTR